jgi:predicted Ser/Thr protein kinase
MEPSTNSADPWGTRDHTPVSPEPIEPGTCPEFIGRYRVQGVLGKGGFGIVYVAVDEQLNRSVAIKMPRYERRLRSENAADLEEAQILASLDHPNIVPVYDVGLTHDGVRFVVSKRIDGHDLATLSKKSNPPLAQKAELVASIAEALHHAHRKGLVHRDVKPNNILVDSAGKAFITDFGLALRDEDFGKKQGISGTPAYMSPEQARGEGTLVDGRSDIFSLGVVFYELLTRRRPFNGSKPEELLAQIAKVDVRPLRQIDDRIPKELERICMKALARRPSDRHLTADDMACDIRSFLARNGSGETKNAVAESGARAEGKKFHANLMFGSAGCSVVVTLCLLVMVAGVTAWQNWPGLAKVDPPIAKVDPPIAKVDPPIAKADPPIAKADPPVAKADPPVAKVDPPVAKVDPPIAKVGPPIAKVEPSAPKVAMISHKTGVASDVAITTDEERLNVKFRVESSNPLDQLRLVTEHKGNKDVKEFDPVTTIKMPNGMLEFSHPVKLGQGETKIWVEAVGKNGLKTSTPLVVDYVPWPVEYHLLTLTPLKDVAATQQLVQQANGTWTCAPVPVAQVELVGKVVWQAYDPRRMEKRPVFVYVNGAKQWMRDMDPGVSGSLEQTFKAKLVLNLDKANEIEIEFPGLSKKDESWPKAFVDCRKPLLDRRLYVQIICPEQHPTPLEDQALKMLAATGFYSETREFVRPGFTKSLLYKSMAVDVVPQRISNRLRLIRDELRQRAEDGFPNDMVLIYFVGGESSDRETLTYGKPPKELIMLEELRQEFAEMYGVQILLLDLTGRATDEQVDRPVAKWFDSQTRHVWLRSVKAPNIESSPLLPALQAEMSTGDQLGEVVRGVGRRLGLRRLRDWFLPASLDRLSLK